MSEEPIKPDPDKKPKRPRDANQLAKTVVDLATGEDVGASPAANKAKAGAKGGKARARTLSAIERREIAQKAARSRWSKG